MYPSYVKRFEIVFKAPTCSATVPRYSETMATPHQKIRCLQSCLKCSRCGWTSLWCHAVLTGSHSHVLYILPLALWNTYVNRTNHASDSMNISHYKLIEHGVGNDGGFSQDHVLQFRAANHAVVTSARGSAPFLGCTVALHFSRAALAGLW